MRKERLELSHLAIQDSKSCASTNSATLAFTILYHVLQFFKSIILKYMGANFKKSRVNEY